MQRSGILFFRVFLLFILSSRIAYSQEDFTKVYSSVNRSVVVIDFEDHVREVGSGVIVGLLPSGSALILTANHVVKDYNEVIVSFAGLLEETYTGVVSQTLNSELDDLALIVVQKPPTNLAVIQFKKSIPRKGTKVGTIGHPQSETYTWTDGSINNIFGKYLLHNAPLDVGSSGGPLLDTCGRLLGMNVQIILPPEKPPEDLAEAEQDTIFKVGSSITLSSTAIVPIIEGWFADIQFKEKWQFKKYCSTLDRMKRKPLYLFAEGAVIVGTGYLIGCKQKWWCSDDIVPPIFGTPTGPPGN